MDASNLKQSLLEVMADWLDKEETKHFLSDMGLSEAEASETSGLHIRMAEAAISVCLSGMEYKQSFA